MGRVDGKVALVTGGASGIGAAVASLLAREGARVVVADLQDELGEAVRDEIAGRGGDVAYRRLDVTREEGWIDLTGWILSRYGRLDVAVNNAGVGCPRVFPTEVSMEGWRRVLDVNLDGVFLGTKHGLAAMMRSEPVKGSIVNVSSIMGLVGLPGLGPYNAAKGGVRLYSKSVALSCAKDRVDVRVNSIHPGFIETPLVRAAMARHPDPEAARRDYEALQPVGRMGEPEDIAYGVLFLASDESKFMTGAELVIDGGYTAV